MLLITGPTGNVGRELVNLLGRPPGPARWRVASRHPAALRAEPGGGAAEVVGLDFFDRGTFSAALTGVETLFLLFPLPGNRAARQAIIPFLHAAQAAGCRHVVYVSVPDANRSRVIPHGRVEAALRASAMSYTVVRCGYFMQNLHRAISTHGVDIAERGELFIPAGRGRTAFVDAADAAAVAARALLSPDDHRNTVYNLTGPAALTMTEVAAELSAVLGYPVRYTDPSLIAFARRLRTREVGWDTVVFMSGLYSLTRLGANQRITDDVAHVLGRPPRTLAEFARDNAWRWRDGAWT